MSDVQICCTLVECISSLSYSVSLLMIMHFWLNMNLFFYEYIIIDLRAMI